MRLIWGKTYGSTKGGDQESAARLSDGKEIHEKKER